jgi:hypothetical protein
MDLAVAYRGYSGLSGSRLSFAPNLRRDRVSFVGNLRSPVRFREAMGALHDVVISDLKFRPKDKSAYQAYLARLRERESAIRNLTQRQKRSELLAAPVEPIPQGLEEQFNQHRTKYWAARQKYSDYLTRNDPAIWRLLMPCDPVVTVANDVLFFECFSKDESTYGCLTADRDGFTTPSDVALGTTNVDYSPALYESFQRLRTYRTTQLAIDPTGFEVRTQGEADLREEQIALPPNWLRGFMQVQAAMTLPARRLSLSREAVYAILAHLKRHRARTSPRALRFELVPGKPLEIVIEPWEKRVSVPTTVYSGTATETIRIWGRDRLQALARVLPLADAVDVYLLGTGLPHFWVARMGDMRLTLGLSGWTANDWTTGAGALADLAPPVEPSEDLLSDVADCFRESPLQSFEQIRQKTGAAPAYVAAAVNRYALLGQLVHDLSASAYRWRSILPDRVALNQVAIESPEAQAAIEIVRTRRVEISRNEAVSGIRAMTGKVDGREVELVLDADGKAIRGRCNCSHYFRFKLRAGPCRHMQALRRVTQGEHVPSTLEQWYTRFVR